jgi:raffinose/stachyose/melibiose transport system permease protein
MFNKSPGVSVGMKHSILWTFANCLTAIWLIIAGAPFVFQILSSFKTQGEFITSSLFDLPKKLYYENYISVFKGGFFRYFFNSLIVLSISLVLLLFISACAAYPLSRLKFRPNKFILGAVVAAMSIPIHITLIPVFTMSVRLNLYDKVYALIGPSVAFNLPMSIFILTTFMRSISKEMEEAAEMDGYGKFSVFFKIILPLSKSGLVPLAIYNGVMIWNDFLFAMLLLQTQKVRTLPLAIWEFQGQYAINIPIIMALLALSSLPLIVLYIIGQDKMIKGIMSGAIKG